MARFIPVPDLDERVAVMVAPEVRKIAEKVGDQARRRAPGTKKWVSMADPRVRDTHVEAHGQEVPENLRFEVRGQQWDIDHGLSPGTDWLLKPKDTSGGLPSDSVQHVHCRCHAALDPTAIARKVKVGPTQIEGAHIRIVVSCEAYKIVECEFGDSYPVRIGVAHSPGTHFMGKAAAAVAAASG